MRLSSALKAWRGSQRRVNFPRRQSYLWWGMITSFGCRVTTDSPTPWRTTTAGTSSGTQRTGTAPGPQLGSITWGSLMAGCRQWSTLWTTGDTTPMCSITETVLVSLPPPSLCMSLLSQWFTWAITRVWPAASSLSILASTLCTQTSPAPPPPRLPSWPPTQCPRPTTSLSAIVTIFH